MTGFDTPLLHADEAHDPTILGHDVPETLLTIGGEVS